MVATTSMMALLAAQTDVGELLRLMSDPQLQEREPERVLAVLGEVNWVVPVLVPALVMLLVASAIYFAVPLVYFWHWPVLAAMLYSVKAMLVNWRPFVAYGVGMIVLAVLSSLLLVLIIALLQLGLGSRATPVVSLLFVVYSLLIQMLVAATQWVAFRQIFPPQGASREPDGGTVERASPAG
ncbi:MAG: hypothetical protein Kow0020_00010 [Wenzhouxiangellaceae bacterium]